MLSQKGILISNPDAQSMTDAQWLWEFHALALEDKRQTEIMTTMYSSAARTLFETLVAVLGCRFKPVNPEEDTVRVSKDKSDKSGHDNNESKQDKDKLDKLDAPTPDSDMRIEPFIPFSYLIASPERIKEAQQEAKGRAQAEAAISDANQGRVNPFDRMTESIAEGTMDSQLAAFMSRLEGRGHDSTDGATTPSDGMDDLFAAIQRQNQLLDVDAYVEDPNMPAPTPITSQPAKIIEVNLWDPDNLRKTRG